MTGPYGEQHGDDRTGDDDRAETGADHEPEALDQLELEDDDDGRLPWLEGDDDYNDEPGSGGGMLRLVLIGVAALAVIVGGIWWTTNRKPDAALIADGGVIEAPDAPYKEKPADPGGKTFEGTGDTSFAVSEGKSRPVRLGQDDAPKPGVDLSSAPAVKPPGKPAAATAPAPATPSAAAAAPASGPGVQVGAFSSRELAETGWTRLSQRYSALSGLRHRVIEGQADIGTVYRLQAVAGSEAAAQGLCSRLKSAGLACQVKN